MFFRVVGWLQTACLLAIGVAAVVSLLATFIRRMRGVAGGILYLCFILWVISLCLWSGANIYLGWGTFLLIVGILLGGVGVVPVALLCFLFTKQWGQAFDLLFQVAVIVAGYYTLSWMMKTSDNSMISG